MPAVATRPSIDSNVDQQYISIADATALFNGVDRQTIYRWRKDSGFPFKRMAGMVKGPVLMQLNEVLAWAKKNSYAIDDSVLKRIRKRVVT